MPDPGTNYAGFWRRALAAALDNVTWLIAVSWLLGSLPRSVYDDHPEAIVGRVAQVLGQHGAQLIPIQGDAGSPLPAETLAEQARQRRFARSASSGFSHQPAIQSWISFDVEVLLATTMNTGGVSAPLAIHSS